MSNSSAHTAVTSKKTRFSALVGTVRQTGHACACLAAFLTPLAILARYVGTWDSYEFTLLIIAYLALLLGGAALVGLVRAVALAVKGQPEGWDR